jgi:hypothetical protein
MLEAVAVDFYQGNIHIGIDVNNLGFKLLPCREHRDERLLTSCYVGVGGNYSGFGNKKPASLSVWPFKQDNRGPRFLNDILDRQFWPHFNLRVSGDRSYYCSSQRFGNELKYDVKLIGF